MTAQGFLSEVFLCISESEFQSCKKALHAQNHYFLDVVPFVFNFKTISSRAATPSSFLPLPGFHSFLFHEGGISHLPAVPGWHNCRFCLGQQSDCSCASLSSHSVVVAVLSASKCTGRSKSSCYAIYLVRIWVLHLSLWIVPGHKEGSTFHSSFTVQCTAVSLVTESVNFTIRKKHLASCLNEEIASP